MIVAPVLLLATALGQSPSPSGPPKIAEVVVPAAVKPEEFSARVGQLKRLSSPDAAARWEIVGGTVGADLVADGKGNCSFSAERSGRYTLACYTSGPIAWVVIVVGDSRPTPGPTPPVPTPPVPEPTPTPADPVADSIRAAFVADPGKPYEKQQWAATLAGVWSAGADYAAEPTPGVTTTGQLVERIRSVAVAKQLSPSQLPKTRAEIARLTAAQFGTTDTPLTPETRKAAATLFTAISKALSEVSK
jgi:hypothetical protein